MLITEERLEQTTTERYALPAGPKSPALVNGLLFLLARQALMRRLQRRYGDAYTLQFPGFGTTVVVARPDLVKQVYTAKPSVLHGGKNPLGEVLGPGSMFSMDEDRHLEERRALLPPFHGDRMRSYDALIEEEALRAMHAWRDEEEFATIKSFNRITLRVILRAVFGAEDAELSDFEELLPRMAALGQRLVTAPVLRRDFGRWSPGRRYAAMRRRYDAIVEVLIGERIDILALMLAPLREAGEEIDRADVADELLTLLLAGHETTATSISWAFDLLLHHPDKMAQLREELASGSDEYLDAVIKETLRIRPVVPGVVRKLKEPLELRGYELPAGTRVAPNIYLTHMNPAVFPEPKRFLPERFLENGADTYSWIPFGGGIRRCLGASFAMYEMKVVIPTILRRVEMEAAGPPEHIRRRAVTFVPHEDGRVLVTEKRSAGALKEAVAA